MSTLLILFFAPLLAGSLIYILPEGRQQNYRLWLVFAGAYLFAITVSHVLPELYREYEDVKLIGIFVLAGFFLQQILEYFTSGVEHGHVHDHHDHHHHAHGQTERLSAMVLLVALCIHAFLEGAMLAQPAAAGPVYDTNAVLIGIVLHRAPAAFALMTVLVFQLGSKKRAWWYLVVFSLAAPLGLLLSRYLAAQHILEADGLMYLYAIVCGNFLHISTTIVFESSPEHRFEGRKLVVAVLGASLAVGFHFIL